MKNEIKELVGTVPSETGFKKRMRFHQGWWRAFVLVEEEGKNPVDRDKAVCNTITNGQEFKRNFLNDRIINAVELTLEERKTSKSGLMDENRLYNNLLSSQPLCFNFFGELKLDKKFARRVLGQFWPEVTKVCKVVFEYAPEENYTGDHSAFDVAFEVMAGNRKGLIGLECKYTDSFSPEKYDKAEYKNIFHSTAGKVFNAEYGNLINPRFNQLFRNQLIAEALIQNKRYEFVCTGLFCHHDDRHAIDVAKDFQSMLIDRVRRFTIITYRDFIESMQKLEIEWERRELSMMLWARYCGLKLSDEAFKQ